MGNQLRSCCKNEDNIDNKLKEDNKEENDDLETGSNNGEDNDIKDMFNTSPKTDNSNYIATTDAIGYYYVQRTNSIMSQKINIKSTKGE